MYTVVSPAALKNVEKTTFNWKQHFRIPILKYVEFLSNLIFFHINILKICTKYHFHSNSMKTNEKRKSFEIESLNEHKVIFKTL